MILVIQGPAIDASLAADAGRLTGAARIERIAARAFRLRGARDDPGLADWCAGVRLDWAWVPDDRSLSALRLLALDMDSTLVAAETIDEMGAAFGIRDRVASVTARAMRGELDYPESLRQRVGLLAGLEEDQLQRILHERMRLSPGAETLFERCRELGIRTLLVSGGFGYFTRPLCERLGIDFELSNDLEIERGRLTGRLRGAIVDGAAKAAKLDALRQQLGLERAQTLAIGDGANDVPMLIAAGVSVAFRAKPAARAAATHALDHAGLDGALHLFH